MKDKITAYIHLSLLALLMALFLWWIYPSPQKKESPELASIATTTKEILFPNVTIEARSAYVYDAITGKALYAKDPELQWPLASVTKLMTALAASDLVPEYMLVRIRPDDVREEGDTGLLPDEVWNVRKLIDYSLLVSSNDGARAIAAVAGSQIWKASTSTLEAATTTPEAAFVARMNELAKKIGLRETYFLNQSGLDVSPTLSGGYGSARDMALLVDYILKHEPHLLEATSLEKTAISSNNMVHDATNTNKAILNIPNVLGSKTGYTDLSGGNVVVAWNAGINHPIIISVLGSSYDGRFKDLSALVDATLEYLSKSATTTSEK